MDSQRDKRRPAPSGWESRGGYRKLTRKHDLSLDCSTSGVLLSNRHSVGSSSKQNYFYRTSMLEVPSRKMGTQIGAWIKKEVERL